MIKHTKPVDKKFTFRDPVLPENNGTFRIRIDASGGSAQQISEKREEESTDISVFAGRIFDSLRIYINEVV